MKAFMRSLLLLALLGWSADMVFAQQCHSVVGSVFIGPEDSFDPGGPLPEDLHPFREILENILDVRERMAVSAQRRGTSLTREYGDLARRLEYLRTYLPQRYQPVELVLYGQANEVFERHKTVEYLRKNPDKFGQTVHMWREQGNWRRGNAPPIDCDAVVSSAPAAGGAALPPGGAGACPVPGSDAACTCPDQFGPGTCHRPPCVSFGAPTAAQSNGCN